MKRRTRTGRFTCGWLGGCVILASVLGASARNQVVEGRLGESSSIMPSDGTYYHMHEFEARQGEEILIDLMSSDFDAFLLVHSPSGEIFRDDDGGEGYNSRLSVTADQSGTWKAFANTVSRGETGAYQLRIQVLDASAFQTSSFSGQLGPDSPRMPDQGAPYGEHRVSLQAGSPVVISLNSTDFDALLHVHAPSGEVFTDDDGGEGTNSRLAFTPAETGEWRIVATSYGADETGAYQMQIRTRVPEKLR